jgi:hypothetical protein
MPSCDLELSPSMPLCIAYLSFFGAQSQGTSPSRSEQKVRGSDIPGLQTALDELVARNSYWTRPSDMTRRTRRT